MSGKFNFGLSEKELLSYDLINLIRIAKLYGLKCDNSTREQILIRIMNYQGIPTSKAQIFSWNFPSKFKLLPVDILRLSGFYLSICQLVRFCRINSITYNNLYTNHQFLRTIGLHRLTDHPERLPPPDKILKEIYLSTKLVISNCEKGYDKPVFRALRFESYTLPPHVIMTFLYQSAKNGYLDIIKHLYENLPITNRGYFNNTLICAIQSDQLNIVDYLVSQGVEVSVNDHLALRTAIILGRLNIMKHLFGYPDKPGILKNFNMKLFLSTSMVSVNDPEMIKYLQSME
jgi:Ankyrin repeats (3 copies)